MSSKAQLNDYVKSLKKEIRTLKQTLIEKESVIRVQNHMINQYNIIDNSNNIKKNKLFTKFDIILLSIIVAIMIINGIFAIFVNWYPYDLVYLNYILMFTPLYLFFKQNSINF